MHLPLYSSTDPMARGAPPRRAAIAEPFRLTIIHPCIGRRPGQRYIRTWQMEPLPAATLAGLTPKDVEVRFYDDRMELIPANPRYQPLVVHKALAASVQIVGPLAFVYRTIA